MTISPKTASYGDHPRQKLDVYRPLRRKRGSPILVFYYGGAWRNGHRSYYRPLGWALSHAGYLCVVADYRLFPEVRFPTFNKDAAAALSWVQSNAASLGGDPDRLGVIGHSAGAHIGATISLDPQYLEEVGLPNSIIKAFAGIAGPYGANLTKYDSTSAIFSDAGSVDATRPIKMINGQEMPRMLLMHGGRDTTVLPQNSTGLADAVVKARGDARTAIYPELGHIDILFSLAPLLRWRAPVWRDLLDFFGHL